MKNCKSTMCMLGILLALMAVATAADTPPLAFKFTTVNVPGALQTFPGGVNNSGVIVGTYVDKSEAAHGYILNGKRLIRLDDPNGTNTDAYNLNPNGTIAVVGAYVNNSTGGGMGFLYKNGSFTDVPGPTGAKASAANGINDAGQVVGWYADTANLLHGFLLTSKTYIKLDVPGAASTNAIDINNKGLIVVVWQDSKGAYYSSLYNGKTYKTIDVPGATSSTAGSLNSAGDVTYGWVDSHNLSHGALLHNGKFYKFDHPKSVQTYAGGVNDRHLIVGGYWTKINGPAQGFTASYK